MIIESVQLSDAEELLNIYAPYVLKTAVTFEYEVPSIDEFTSRIEDALKKHVYIKAVGDDGRIEGFAFAHSFRPRPAYDHCVEVTIYVREDMRGQGIGRALYDVLEKHLSELGYTNLYACVAVGEDEYLTNASPMFHTSMGYKEIGVFNSCGRKFNHVYDMIWYEKIIKLTEDIL